VEEPRISSSRVTCFKEIRFTKYLDVELSKEAADDEMEPLGMSKI
jgi:hypothetical protein